MFARLFDNPVAVVILVLIIVVVFGWKKLPDAARSLGRSTRILKSELDGMNGESKASKETVQGETSTSGQSASASDRVPGESSSTQASDAQSTQGQSQQGDSGQGSTSGQQGGPQAG